MPLTKVSYAMINGAPINVLDYGAVGDGTHNDTAAFQAAVNYAVSLITTTSDVSESIAIYVPSGTYVIDETITFTGPITIFGDGSQQSVIWFSNTTDWCFEFTADLATDCMSVMDIGFRAMAECAGGAIKMTGVHTASNNFRNTYIRNAYIYSDFSSYGWQYGVYIKDCWHYLIEDCFFKGATAVADWAVIAFDINDYCIDGRIQNTYVYGAKKAIAVASHVEGFRATNNSMVAVDYGIYFSDNTSWPPHYDISHNHIAASTCCIYILGTSQVIISDNVLYLGNQASSLTPNNSKAVYLGSVLHGAIFSNNKISKETVTSGYTVTGIIVENTSDFAVVNNNISDFTGYGVYITANCGNGSVDSNVFYGNTTNLTTNNAGTVYTRKINDPRVYNSQNTITLTGGATSEYVNVSIPSGYFTAPPVYGSLMLDGISSNGIIGFFISSSVDPATTTTNAKFLIQSIGGATLPSGGRRFNVLLTGV